MTIDDVIRLIALVVGVFVAWFLWRETMLRDGL